MSELSTRIQAFDTHAGARGSVYVSIDEDLTVKFGKGEVCKGNNGDAYGRVAMVLGVDRDACDVITLDGSPEWSLYDTLMSAKAAIELALDGYAKS